MNEIQQELNELGAKFPKAESLQEVPDGYFESFNEELIQTIVNQSFTEGLPKNMPQDIPSDYFDKFNQHVFQQIHEESSALRVYTPKKSKSWALAASIALILSIGFYMFSDSENKAISSQLAELSANDFEEYMEENAYDFNDYIVEGNTTDLKSVENAIFEEAEVEGLSKDELLEFAL